VVVARDGGLRSLTRFERLDEARVASGHVATLRCSLVTGRMHQLRVHLASRGWPIVGDPRYGSRDVEGFERGHPAIGFPRQALHAWRLRFVHPFTGRNIEVEAPVPADMRTLIEACGLKPATP
jgi:23S rRNA pseudouridine1911/1915/1917 synthase